jgi:hypothetical protein
MSNEVYTDLEREYLDKSDSYLDIKQQLDTVINLVKQYPNDADLGAKIREFVNLQKK